MIIALEGPDRCGKTSVMHELQSRRLRAKFIPTLPVHRDLMPVMHWVEKRQAALWKLLYDRSKLYIADRFFAVSAPVYDALYNRPQLDISMWLKEVHVVYFDVPTEVLAERHRLVGDELFDVRHYDRAKKLYESVIRKFRYIRVDGRRPVHDIAEEISCLAESLRG